MGDFDPAGLLIDRSLEDELRSHTATPVAFERVAVNEAQIVMLNLPAKPRKASEKRLPSVAETVEAESMPAPVLRRLVREAVERHLTPESIDYARLMEEQGQAFLRAFG